MRQNFQDMILWVYPVHQNIMDDTLLHVSSQESSASLKSWMSTLDPKGHILKVSLQYFYYWLRYRLNKENRPIVIMPTHPKLTQVPRVIHDILDVVGRPQGSYAESSV